jgi:hypothetical protein
MRGRKGICGEGGEVEPVWRENEPGVGFVFSLFMLRESLCFQEVNEVVGASNKWVFPRLLVTHPLMMHH